eukprot:UC1_evm1s1935
MSTLPYNKVAQADEPVKPRRSAVLASVTAPHVQSFNMMLRDSLPRAVADLTPSEVMVNERRVIFGIEGAEIGIPSARRDLIYPSECRQRRSTYRADLVLRLRVDVEGQTNGPLRVERTVGQVPIMVMSDRCHLRSMSPHELISHHEEAEEMGGYFIINGNERIIRMLLMPRRNHPMALIRPSFTNRGPSYTEFGCLMRCVASDGSAQTVILHYLSDGTCVLGFSYRKQQYLIPAILLLRALGAVSDREIFEAIVQGDTRNSFLTERAEILLEQYAAARLYTRSECLRHLGSRFRIALGVPVSQSDEEAGLLLLRRVILIHVPAESLTDKYRVLIGMARKLYSLAAGNCIPDNPDSQMNQELLLPGQLYGAVLKEQMQEYIQGLTGLVTRDVRQGKLDVDFSETKYLKHVLGRSANVGKKLEYLLTTGNLNSPTGLDLQQVSGFTIVADKLNFLRYMSHFRCVHRGAFFSQMKTTAVRKLLPEAWGCDMGCVMRYYGRWRNDDNFLIT